MEEGGGGTKSMLMLAFLLVLDASVTCTTHSTLPANQSIRYNETIVSPQETFELGFFMPGNSTNHYVGIWYKKIPTRTVVWVANRNSPLTNTTGDLTLTVHGVLILRDLLTGNVLWSSSSSSRASVRNPIAQLLDTGNFVVYDNADIVNQNNPIWQSFDFLTDTLLPGMKLGRDLVTGIERHFTSWKSVNDPAAGDFSKWLDTSGYPQPVERHNRNIIFRAGPWNGVRFSGNSHLRPNPIFTFTFVLNQREIYYQYNLINASVYNRLVLLPSGRLERLTWIYSKQDWVLYFAPQTDQCDQYAVCGPLGICDISSPPVCECLKGFEPRSPEQWNVADWSQGCKRTTPLDCGSGEGFKKYSNLKLPDTQASCFNQVMTLVECEKMCKSNCSCTAYTYLNKSATGSGTGCLQWFGDLIDIRIISGNGDDLYIRLPPSELDSTENSISSNAGRLVRVIVPVASVALVILVLVCFFYRFKRSKQEQEGTPRNVFGHDPENESADADLELPLFDLSTILKATDNCSLNSILGEGGFGPVHKVHYESMSFYVLHKG